jgi:choline dehydrogenase-like flavoprotein
MESLTTRNIENGINDHVGTHTVSNRESNGVNGYTDSQPYFDCVVVGAGMAGLSAAGRLKALGVSAVTLERNAKIGQNWTNRYDTVRLHTAKENGHLPFSRIFPPEDPYFLSGQDLARGYQRFIDQYGINVWLSTNLDVAAESGGYTSHACHSTSYLCPRQWWSNSQDAYLRRQGGRPLLDVRIFCQGSLQIGSIPGHSDAFQRIQESQQVERAEGCRHRHRQHRYDLIYLRVYPNLHLAHDVAEDMIEAGLASITMVQRNRTS